MGASFVRSCLIAAAFILGAAPAAVRAEDPLAERLGAADVKRGENIARRCIACHSFEKGGPHKVGPNLWGVVGTPFGSKTGFKRYSPGLRKMAANGAKWDLETLDAYLARPRGVIPNGTMAFAGLPRAADRADILLYLRSLSDDPVPMPRADKPVSGAPESAGAAPTPQNPDYAAMPDTPGRDEVYSQCAGCHSMQIVSQQNLSRERWDKLLSWMVEEQGMSPLEGETRKVVLDYLERHYGSKSR